jgi:hypothetical protein
MPQTNWHANLSKTERTRRKILLTAARQGRCAVRGFNILIGGRKKTFLKPVLRAIFEFDRGLGRTTRIISLAAPPTTTEVPSQNLLLMPRKLRKRKKLVFGFIPRYGVGLAENKQGDNTNALEKRHSNKQASKQANKH